MDEYEESAASPESIVSEASTPPRSRKSKPKAKPSAKSSSKRSVDLEDPMTSPPARPPPRPLGRTASTSQGHSGRSNTAIYSNSFTTAAEKRKEHAAQQKREAEDCFDFIKPENIKDKYGHRPDHPDYDPRTILVPRSAFEKLSPFEKQFWSIKQDHFDTVLFFQKGKFFELYEEDAKIGHRDFDLKLTERVKMCMVSGITACGATRPDHPGRRARTEFRVLGGQVPCGRIQGRKG
jgi:DNA mismatch repair protein MSH6